MSDDFHACGSDVHDWFELSYSSYLVLPRSLMQEMTSDWQHKMVRCLEEMRATFPNEHGEYAVFRREGGRFVKDPLRNYRYPNNDAIDVARGDPR
jgi:hypothetical protein